MTSSTRSHGSLYSLLVPEFRVESMLVQALQECANLKYALLRSALRSSTRRATYHLLATHQRSVSMQTGCRHPLNFRNQAKRFEVEQAHLAKDKREAAAKAEFEAEQQYLGTLAHLPGKEAEKYRQMQGVSWMYVRPPGLAMQEEGAAAAAAASASGTAPRSGGAAAGGASEPGAAPSRNVRPKTQDERGQGALNASVLA